VQSIVESCKESPSFLLKTNVACVNYESGAVPILVEFSMFFFYFFIFLLKGLYNQNLIN
jgi:hypothetical protein